jgi:hypothetical protein
VRIEAKPLQLADTDNNDDDTPTYLEADTKRTVGIPRAAAAAAAAPLFCSSFAAGKQKKGAGKTERVKNESEKREREEAEVADAEQNYKAEEAAG